MFLLIQREISWSSHQEVNAGWLFHLVRTFPDCRIIFFSKWSHWVRVKQALPDRVAFKKQLTWLPVGWFPVIRQSRSIIRQLSKFGFLAFIFLGNIEFASKFAKELGGRSPETAVYGVFHQELEALREAPYGAFSTVREEVLQRKRVRIRLPLLLNWENFRFVFHNFWRRVLSLFKIDFLRGKPPSVPAPHYEFSKNFTGIVLSRHILQPLSGEVAALKPVLMPFSVYPDYHKNEDVNVFDSDLVLATLGNGNHENALLLFEEIFRKEENESWSQSLLLRALTMNSRGFDRYERVESFCFGRIPRSLVEKKLSDVAFLLFPYSSGQFTRSASGAQMEILRFGIPHISLRNTHLEELHRRFGEIGTLCDSIQEWAETIRNFVLDRDLADETRSRQRANLNEAKVLYSQFVSEDMRTIFGEKCG